jgi:hypothetical protein
MAQRLVFKFNATEPDRNIARFLQRAPNAIRRALNRGAVSARTFLVKEIAKDTGLKSGEVRDAIKIREATAQNLTAEVSITGKRIPLIKFNARGPEPSRGRGRGVTARGPGLAGRYPQAFIATVGSGRHRGVFQRRTKARLPIRELFGPSLPHVFGKLIPEAAKVGEASLVKNLQHELAFALGGPGTT